MIGVGAFGEIRWSAASSARLGFAYEFGAPVSADVGRLQFARALAQVEGCPWGLAWAHVTVAPCVHVDAGAVLASSSDIPNSRQVVRPWVAAGPAVLGRFAPRDSVFIEIHAALPFSLVRDRFFFEPSTTVDDVPAIGAVAGLAVGAALR
jgi:hypothetical protein